jgi:myotubularin-related protein 5/13
MSFEFNQHYLKFLAYHHVSNRFRTFMMDNESRRVEAGWMLEESKMATKSEPSLGETDSIHAASSNGGSISVWDYIDEHRKNSPTFYNFFFTARDQEPVSFVGFYY